MQFISSGSIFTDAAKRVNRLVSSNATIVDLGVGDPGKIYGVPNFICGHVVDEIYSYKMSGYPDPEGSDEFRIAASTLLLKNFNVVVDPKTEICMTNSTKTALGVFAMSVLDPGDTVIIPVPGYPGFRDSAILSRAIPYFVYLNEDNGFLIDYESIPQNIAKKAKLIWINYPNSPIGAMCDIEWLNGLINWANKHNIIVASDEVYVDLYCGNKPISVLNVAQEGVVAFHSVSKRSCMSSFRIGYVSGDKSLIDRFLHVKSIMDDGMPQFIQSAAIASFKDEAHVIELRNRLNENRSILFRFFATLGCEPSNFSTGGLFLWQKAPKNMNSYEFADFLENNYGIVVIPGGDFYKLYANEEMQMSCSYVRASTSICDGAKEILQKQM